MDRSQYIYAARYVSTPSYQWHVGKTVLLRGSYLGGHNNLLPRQHIKGEGGEIVKMKKQASIRVDHSSRAIGTLQSNIGSRQMGSGMKRKEGHSTFLLFS